MARFFDWGNDVPRDEKTGALVPVPHNRPRALTASAQRISLKNTKDMEKLAQRKKRVKWQTDAFAYYDLIGEVKFAANLVANVISRINIYVGYVNDTARVPEHIKLSEDAKEYADTAEAILNLLESGDDGTSGLLRITALNLFVTGEFYLVKIPANSFSNSPEKWEVHSVDEIVVEGVGDNTDVYIKSSPDEDRKFWFKLPRNGYVCRMWRKHPQYTAEADSSMKGVLDDCDDLLLYTREGRSVSKSRISSGLLFLPDGLANSSVPDSDAEDGEESDGSDSNEPDIADEIAASLIEPIADDLSIYSASPLVIQGPEDLGSKIKYISFARPIDPMYQQNLEFKLERILSGLDIPKDIAKGMSSVKYSNATVIEDSLYKSHIEPLILMITDVLTNGFLRPALIGNGVPEEIARKIVVWFDPSAVLTKIPKSEAAQFGISNQLISDSAWRASNGFSDSDKPSEAQIARDLIRAKLVLSDPQMVENFLEMVLPELMKGSREASLGTSDPSSASALNEALGVTPEGIEYVSEDPQAEASAQPTPGADGLLEPEPPQTQE